MGDEVNVAARLEAANKTLGTDILVSASTSKSAGSDAVFCPRGVVEVKGRKEPVAVFELLSVAAAEDHETIRGRLNAPPGGISDDQCSVERSKNRMGC
jgi:adenylate cyclase